VHCAAVYIGVVDAFMLNNKVALVTGAGRGIGAACATMLAQAGASVALLDLDAASAETRTEAIRARGGALCYSAVAVLCGYGCPRTVLHTRDAPYRPRHGLRGLRHL
jgi:NAD(P)-dependent dehydrogenase (short-subunit alcohol dehydrogenase family)